MPASGADRGAGRKWKKILTAQAAYGRMALSSVDDATIHNTQTPMKTATRPTLAVRRLNRFPGDTSMTITRAATDATGKTWPAGTVCQPSSAGMYGSRRYQAVHIAGNEVTFFGR